MTVTGGRPKLTALPQRADDPVVTSSADAAYAVEAVVAPASFGWVLLQLHYDGRRPPVALLRDIAALGWSVPPPPARPARAIDWHTPDPATV